MATSWFACSNASLSALRDRVLCFTVGLLFPPVGMPGFSLVLYALRAPNRATGLSCGGCLCTSGSASREPTGMVHPSFLSPVHPTGGTSKLTKSSWKRVTPVMHERRAINRDDPPYGRRTAH